MPIEQSTAASPAEAVPVSAIENEIPTYRAISPQAVGSLLLGFLAILSFAHWIFLICAVAAVVVGILADRRIVRENDVLTGRGIAQAGITLGLIFGLSMVTITTVQNWIVVSQAAKFAKTYEDVLQKGTLEDALWYGQNPPYRSGKTPAELMTEMKKGPRGSSMFDMQNAALMRLKSRLSEGGADIHFSRIEQHGKEGVNPFAAALFELHSEGSQPLPDDERFAMVVLKGMTRNRRLEWWVENVGFPYTPDSFKPAVKAADDGHGHVH